jgi:signal transduction histidine kinase
MIRLLALVLSIILLMAASSIALSFMKLTKFRLSWIFLSAAFVFMAIIKVIELFEFFQRSPSYTWQMIEEWMGVFVSVLIIVGVTLIRDIFTSLKRAEIDRQRSEKKVLTAIINTEENERKRFAKDLHDGLAPLLSTVKMSLSALTNKIIGSPGTEILENTNHLVNEAINTIKDISNNLSPHVLENFGIESALGTFISKINQTKVIEIIFKSNLNDERIESDKEVVLYRAACELINNSVKHSGASKIEIDLNRHERFIILQLSDNGRGFDQGDLKRNDNKGMGLSNIETRVKSVEGAFVIESAIGKGTTALIKIVD